MVKTPQEQTGLIPAKGTSPFFSSLPETMAEQTDKQQRQTYSIHHRNEAFRVKKEKARVICICQFYH